MEGGREGERSRCYLTAEFGIVEHYADMYTTHKI